jgi:hypothetical protein
VVGTFGVVVLLLSGAAAVRPVRLKNLHESAHRRQDGPQLLGTHLGPDPGGPCVLLERDPADRPVSGLRAGEQSNAPVDGCVAELGQPPIHEQVGHPPDTLACHPHSARNLSHATRLVEHPPEDLPPRGSHLARSREILRDVEKGSVELVV